MPAVRRVLTIVLGGLLLTAAVELSAAQNGDSWPKGEIPEQWRAEMASALLSITGTYSRDCSVNLFYEDDKNCASVAHMFVLDAVGANFTATLQLHHISQEVLSDPRVWSATQCNANVFLVVEGELLSQHASVNHFLDRRSVHSHPLWNYEAYNILVLLNKQMKIRDFSKSYAFRRSRRFLQMELSNKGEVMLYTDYPYKGRYHSLLTSFRSWQADTVNLFGEKLANFDGATLRISTFEHPPSVLYAYDSDRNIIERLGVDMKLLLTLEKALNFQSVYNEVNEGELWGHQLKNGTWTGLMGELINDRADIGICNVFIEEGRWEYIDFTSAYNFERGCFATASPKSLPRWTSPVLPFSSNTWVTIAVSFFVATGVLFFLAVASTKKESSEYRSVTFDCLYVLGFFTLRSQETKPKYGPLRIYLSFVGLFATLITTAYSANLVAFLSTVQKMQPIDTMKQLKGSNLRLGGTDFWKTQFVASIDSDIQSFEKRLEARYDLKNLFDEVERGEFAIIGNKQFLELFVAGRYTYGDVATIRIVSQCLLPYSIGVGLQKFSPLRETFGKVTSHIFESGLTQRWKKETIMKFREQFANEIEKKERPRESLAEPLGIDHLLGVFMVYVIGLAIALLTFLAEIIFTEVSEFF